MAARTGGATAPSRPRSWAGVAAAVAGVAAAVTGVAAGVAEVGQAIAVTRRW